MAKRFKTGDGRDVAAGEWSDTEIVQEEVVDRYCECNGVGGIVVLDVDDELGPLPYDGSSAKLN